MKLIQNIICLLSIGATIFTSCSEEKISMSPLNEVTSISVKVFNDNNNGPWSGIISAETDTIYFDIPYYLSAESTEPTPLNKMIIEATLPYGSILKPGLSGIQDMTNPMSVIITAADGSEKAYVLKARLKKSDKKEIVSFSIPSLGLKGINKENNIVALIVPPGYDESTLVNVAPSITISPWASISPSPDAPQDFTKDVVYTITAQDGSSQEITIKKVLPDKLDYGFGITNMLWNKTKTELGFYGDTNLERNLAVTGDYLIVTRDWGVSPLLIDKMTGKKVGELNISGIEENATGEFQGIAADTKGNLIGANYVQAGNADHIFKLYRWSNGVTNKPETILSLPAKSFDSSLGSINIGGFIGVTGDIDGDAQILVSTVNGGNNESRSLRFEVKGGVITNANNPEILSTANTVTYQWRSNAIPTSAESNTPYLVMAPNYPGKLVYMDENRKPILFNTAPETSAFFNYSIFGISYIEFNHAKYIFAASVNWSYQFKIIGFDITDPSRIPLTNASDQYNKFHVFTSDKTLDQKDGQNGNGFGAMATQVSADGNSLYVYMLAGDTGIIAYELSIYGDM